MSSKLLSYILTALVTIGVLLTLNEMYNDSNSALKGSIYYISSPITIAFMLTVFRKRLKDSIKWLNILSLSAYAIFAFLLALIALYSSPSDRVEPLASALFYLAGVLALCNMLFIKYKRIDKKQEDISMLHKIFRYIILAALLFYIAITVYDIYNIKSMHDSDTKQSSLPLG